MTDIYQAGTKVWEEVEGWADSFGSTPYKCFLELRSRIEYLEETLKEIAYDQLTTLSQELQGDEYKTLVTKDQALARWGNHPGSPDSSTDLESRIEDLEALVHELRVGYLRMGNAVAKQLPDPAKFFSDIISDSDD